MCRRLISAVRWIQVGLSCPSIGIVIFRWNATVTWSCSTQINGRRLSRFGIWFRQGRSRLPTTAPKSASENTNFSSTVEKRFASCRARLMSTAEDTLKSVFRYKYLLFLSSIFLYICFGFPPLFFLSHQQFRLDATSIAVVRVGDCCMTKHRPNPLTPELSDDQIAKILSLD